MFRENVSSSSLHSRQVISMEQEAFAQLDFAVKEAGINFIDTAELYPVPPNAEACGRTEEYIGMCELSMCLARQLSIFRSQLQAMTKGVDGGGRWLAREGPEMRKKIILASKVLALCPTTETPLLICNCWPGRWIQ